MKPGRSGFSTVCPPGLPWRVWPGSRVRSIKGNRYHEVYEFFRRQVVSAWRFRHQYSCGWLSRLRPGTAQGVPHPARVQGQGRGGSQRSCRRRRRCQGLQGRLLQAFQGCDHQAAGRKPRFHPPEQRLRSGLQRRGVQPEGGRDFRAGSYPVRLAPDSRERGQEGSSGCQGSGWKAG